MWEPGEFDNCRPNGEEGDNGDMVCAEADDGQGPMYWTRQQARQASTGGNNNHASRGRAVRGRYNSDPSRPSTSYAFEGRNFHRAPGAQRATSKDGRNHLNGNGECGQNITQNIMGQLYPDQSQQQESKDDPVNNSRVRALLDQRPGPSGGQTARANAPPPQESMQQDSRGDWYPKIRRKPNWDELDNADSRPFASQLPPQGDDIDPRTSHGRYMINLYNRFENREKRTLQKRMDDTASTTSFNMQYGEEPVKRGQNYAPAPDLTPQHSDGDNLREQNDRLRRDLRAANRTIRTMERDGYSTSASSRRRDDDDYGYRSRQRKPEVKNLKVPKFNGKEFAGFKVAFMRCAKLLDWDEDTAQTQLICTCEGPARNVVMQLPEGTSVIDMLHALELRYGINMSFANVDNKLADVRRKPGEDLHTLYDRVMALARRADYTPQERAYKARSSFFQALRTDSDLQHYVGRRDKIFPPSIDVTLGLALQYEMTYGRKDNNTTTSSAKQVTTSNYETADCTEYDTEGVHQLGYTSLKTVKDPTLRQIGKQQNEMVEVMKKTSQLLQQHLTQPAPKGKSSQHRSDNPAKSKGPPASRKKPFPKKTNPKGGKGRGGKPFNNKSKVHQVGEAEEEDAEDEPDEYEDAEEGECPLAEDVEDDTGELQE